MNMYRLHCHNTEELYDFIAQHHLAQYEHIFVQVAANKVDQLELRKMIGLLQRYLPQAQLFGVTYGEHFGFDDKFFICFTVFEKVSVRSVLLSYEEFA
ncbi:diguanylate cyclase, partial [Parageobacillus sp. SY1]